MPRMNLADRFCVGRLSVVSYPPVALSWLRLGRAFQACIRVALLTAFVSWIAFRTVVLAVRGQLFPAWPPVHQGE